LAVAVAERGRVVGERYVSRGAEWWSTCSARPVG